MAYTTQQAMNALDGYLGIQEDKKEYIEDTKNRGFVLTNDSGEKAVIFVYPLVHKQDNTKNYFDTRDSGAYERGVAWNYAIANGYKYFCFGINNQVSKYNDYVFSLECNEAIIEKVSGTKDGVRSGKGNQIIIPNDYVPAKRFERIKNRLGIYISVVRKDGLAEYMSLYDNRPYLLDNSMEIEVEEEAPEERNKRLFRYWMGLQINSEGDSAAEKAYSSASIDQYVSNISKIPLPMHNDKCLFYTSEVGDVKKIIELMDSSDKKDNEQESAAKKYMEFLLEQLIQKESDEVIKHNLFGIHIKEKNDALSEDHPHICIGWSALGDLSSIHDKDSLAKLYDKHFSKTSIGRGIDIGQVWRFKNDIQVGDYVIFAENSLFHIGRIESEYYFDDADNMAQSTDYRNNRKVKWIKKNLSRSILSDNFHNSLKTAMSIWTLNDYKSAVADIIRGTYEKDDSTEMDVEYMKLTFKTTYESGYERNRIVFGAPGTGKSYGLKDDSEILLNGCEENFERVTFHPDYSYSQFVGTYKPVMDADGKSIRYDFVPGPFMRVYVSALKSGRTDDPQPHLLLIEEINRAKVAAVFGDVFQLLDRDDDGVSEYEIQASEDIRRYLAKELNVSEEECRRIRIPNNMFIWSTMNSADQGVFPMDTAFKRRWYFEYLGINENEEEIAGIGRIQLANTDEPIEWNLLRRAINDKMASSEFKINEDKLMGPFFLAKKVIASDVHGMIKDTVKFVDAFKSKVIMYLYEDAVKQGKHRFFDGCDSSKYSAVCDEFDRKGIAIFGATFKETYYDKQRDEM